jgi:hypothetical protein
MLGRRVSQLSAMKTLRIMETDCFSIRRRAERGSIRLRDHTLRGPRDARSEPIERELPATPKTGSETTSDLLPPPFDVSELGNYVNAGGDQEVCLGECDPNHWYLIYSVAPEDRSSLVSERSRTPSLSMAEVSSGALPSHASPLVDCSGRWKGNRDAGLAQLY